MRFYLFAAVLSICFAFVGCSTSHQEQAPVAKTTLEDSLKAAERAKIFMTDCKKLHREALRMDSILLRATEINKTDASKAMVAFTDLAHYCPGDSLSPIYLIKTAQVAQAINNVPQAKVALDKCIGDYPNFKDRAAALFLLAQLYDEVTYLNNEEQAKELYQKIINEYPKSPWASSAKGALRFIGKTDAEIIKELEKKHQ